jgi:glycerophosphoryl diester phosphodiesterase
MGRVGDVLLYGHRGARGEAPENTEAGFRYARALYLDGVQLDVRLSSDDELVVIHDETVDRTTTARGQVSRMKAAKLAGLDARVAFPDWPEAAGVPALDDVLDACSGIQRLIVSIQPDTPKRLRTACELIAETFERRWITDRVLVMSTSEPALELMATIAPFFPRALAGWFKQLDGLEAARRLRCREIAVPPTTGSASLVQAAHDLDLLVVGWLANTAEEVQACARWGVDSIVSDFPTIARRALAALP